MEEKIYGQVDTDGKPIDKRISQEEFMGRVVKRAKHLKRKRRLQNKYCLTR